MSFYFNPDGGVIAVRARVVGPTGGTALRLALDTGATITTLSTQMLVSIGYDPAVAVDRRQLITGSGVEYVARIEIQQFRALGQVRTNFPILCHTLPPGAGIDGVLGLDFLRRLALNIDFRAGQITLQ